MALNPFEYSLFALDTYSRTEGATNPVDAPLNALILETVSEGQFHATAYEVIKDGQREIVISYRGTDDPAGDLVSGYGIGIGSPQWSEQAAHALNFFNYIKVMYLDPTIVLTGHSLGGGLAGFVGALKGVNSFLFDTMTFAESVETVHNWAVTGDPQRQAWIDAVYGNQATTTPDFDKQKAYHLDGEFLELLRGMEQFQGHQRIVSTELDFINADLASIPASLQPATPFSPVLTLADIALESNARHSMGMLAVRLAGEGISDWKPAALDTFSALYSGSLISKLGLDSSDALQKMLAYSATGLDAEFSGSTALSSMYLGMQHLGRAINQGLVDTSLLGYRIAEYAGRLAVTQDTGPMRTFLDFTGNVLSADYRSDAWTFNGTEHSADSGTFARDFSSYLDDKNLSLIEKVNLDGGPGRVDFEYYGVDCRQELTRDCH